VGIATAFLQTHQLNWFDILLILIGVAAPNFAVNGFKKHFTFKSRGSQDPEPPLSGGSGTLQANPGLEINTLILCLAALGIIAAVGLLIGAFLG
jgi:1,4-dihydroxy-2-naphthoate octaprenyltransferase